MNTTQNIKSRFPDLNFVKPLPVEAHPRYKPFNVKFDPKQFVLPKGHAKEEGRKQMLVDSFVYRDTPIPLRDGLHVYADIFRPVTSDESKVPVVICWSPYGKSSISIDGIWHRSGVPRDWTSGYETFEGLDPADWCRRGYAVVNVDARGAQFSEGTFFFWGDQEAEDIYDAIDYMSKQPWCNGCVCMGGNSYLAKAQVNFASRQTHPALKALAPWEGFTDIYRQLLRRGGFAMHNTFMSKYQWGVAGNHEVEDMAQMVKTHPLFDEYWAGKCDAVENINVPLYLLGSFSNPFHVQGSFDTYRRAGSTKKWMRVHANFEWYEMYERNSNDDLQRFFDRYCKGIMNGWEHDTPSLRLSLHGYGSIPNIVERPETEFPLRRQRLETYYLDAATKSLYASPRDAESSVCHDGHGLEATTSVSYQNWPRSLVPSWLRRLITTIRILLSISTNILRLPATRRSDFGCPANKRMIWMSLSNSGRLINLKIFLRVLTFRVLFQKARSQLPKHPSSLALKGSSEPPPPSPVIGHAQARMGRRSFTNTIASKRFHLELSFRWILRYGPWAWLSQPAKGSSFASEVIF